MDSNTVRRTLSAELAALLGSTSLVAVTSAMPAVAQEMVAQADEIPETVLITGSLIRGTAAVGVPVTNLSPADFAMVGALTTADLFRSFPAANVLPNSVATNSGATIERGVKVNLRGLDTGTATRSLMMIDGIRFPGQGNGQCVLDPSIIPALSIDHIDVLVDGASATYGSDAVGGVINIILKRNMDGAITQFRWTTAAGGKNRYLASAVWGRTWDGGQVTISYEWFDETPTVGKNFSMFGLDHRPWGFDDRRPIGSSLPGTISTGAAAQQGGGKVGTNAQIGSGCTNCYAIPLGAGQNWDPGSSGIGPGPKPLGNPGFQTPGVNLINWGSFANAGNGGTNGLRNQFDPYDISYYDAHQARNGGHITVDQRLTSNISFFGDAFYSNRRGKFVNPGNLGPSAFNAMNNVAVPTFNPYYPVGGAPNNLRVSYYMGWESPGITSFYELAQRYSLGLNIALPAGWSGRVYYSHTRDANYNIVRGDVNKNAVSAALGWTINGAPAAGTTPAIGTWTKPANVPYLNLFCDPLEFVCNSDVTIGYATGSIRNFDQRFHVNEKGGVFDGPLFDLPGGEVKAAVGATYTTFINQTTTIDNTNAPTLLVPYQQAANKRAVWAVFTQINVPVFSDQNGFFGMRRLDLEFSWRHDQYSDVGGTSNPKVAFNWAPINDFMIRGTWGSSFRAPAFGEISPLANVAIAGQNLAQFAAQATPITAGCTSGLPPVGSGAWKLMSSLGAGGNGTPGSAAVCPTGPLAVPGFNIPNVQELPGISMNGGAGAAAPIREGGGWDGSWSGLTPEQATNWGIGFDYTPTGNFLTGLNLQATYYIIKLNSVLRGFGNPTSDSFNDPTLDFAFLVPTDFANNPNLPGSAACTSNLLPTTCQPFQDAVTGLINNPRATVDPQAKTLIFWINDGGTFNKGWIKLDGIDFSASYDWDWGDIGAFNVGVVGTYYLHRRDQSVPGGVIGDDYHTTLNAGQPNEANGVQSQNAGKMRYRARVGWSNGPWSVTGFMDYRGHYYHTQSPPPNVNGNFCANTPTGLDSLGGGGTFPCPIQDYTNIQPGYYTFDLSFGYNTMDLPANEYLRNIGFQLVVQNILDKHGSYQYRISTGGGNPCTCDLQFAQTGRLITLIVTKEW